MGRNPPEPARLCHYVHVRRIIRGDRPVDRLLNFSDAVVAVAITVLALPLFDFNGPQDGETVLDVLGRHQGQILTFASTFLVVGILWTVHNRVMNALDAYDPALFWLNICWLIGFVFLPWPSAMHAMDNGMAATGPFQSDGTGVLYWLTLAYISGVGALTSAYISHHTDLLRPEDVPAWQAMRHSRLRFRGLAFTTVFIVAAGLSLVYSWLGVFALFLLIPLNRIFNPASLDQSEEA